MKAAGPLYVKDANCKIEEWGVEEMKTEWVQCEKWHALDVKMKVGEEKENREVDRIIGDIAALATGQEENPLYFVDTQGMLQ